MLEGRVPLSNGDGDEANVRRPLALKPTDAAEVIGLIIAAAVTILTTIRTPRLGEKGEVVELK